MDTKTFHQKIYQYFSEHKRILPWRYEADPYRILISEVMLQQTQVSRVLVKYPEFIRPFPTVQSLAQASLSDVLQMWQGLGYNRRGKYLREAAERIIGDEKYRFMRERRHPEKQCDEGSRSDGILLPRPTRDQKDKVSTIDSGSLLRLRSGLSGMTGEEMTLLLQELPGIGQATAAAIVAYAFNIPVVFVETNIRSVYLYHYFNKESNVSDKDIAEKVEKTLDYANPREWYYALTDYGAMLKRTQRFANTQSKHYSKQSRFEGSFRQVRGCILRHLSKVESATIEEIAHHYSLETDQIQRAVDALVKEGMITVNDTGTIQLG